MGIICSTIRFACRSGALLLLLALSPAIAAAASVSKTTEPETNAAQNAKLEKLGPLLSLVGEEAAQNAGGKSDGLFVYAEVQNKSITVFVFRDRGKTVMWFLGSPRLWDLVGQVWQLESADKRWAAMAYEVNGRKFDTHLFYPEEVDFKKPFPQRLHAAMPERFAGKKILMDRAVKEFGR